MMATLQAVSPEVLLIALASVMYLAGAFIDWPVRRWLGVSLGGLAAAGVTLCSCAWQATLEPSAVVVNDPLARFGVVLTLLTGAALLLLSTRLPERETAGEYFASLLLVVAGGMLVAVAQELVVLFLGLELISIPTYVLLCLARQDASGQESATKYFLLSVFSSALFLYGVSLVYGAVGSTHLGAIRDSAGTLAGGPTVLIAVTVILAGLAFKLAAVPLHFYAPDVYQGTATMTAALLAWAPKAAGVFAVLRLVVFSLPSFGADAAWLLWLMAAGTMTVGNIMGLLQDNLRRLLAYSSVAHAGYLLIGVGVACVGSERFLTAGAVESVLFYLVAYAAMTLGAFAVLAYLDNPRRPVETIADLAGLARTHPGIAAATATLMIGLTGIPLTAGFWGKLALFASAVTCHDSRYLWLAVIGVLNAAISSYYYLRIVGAMYMRDSAQPVQPAGGRGPLLVVMLGATLTVLIGLLPGPVLRSVQGLEPARQAASQLSVAPAPTSPLRQ
jgi:NADH-quinone oxidoreductase subunit N